MPFPGRLARLRPLNRSRSKLPFPAAPHLRIAQISPCGTFDAVECFAFERWPEIDAFRPQALVGSALALHMLAVRVREKMLDLSCVDRAIFLTSQCGGATLSDSVRVILWQTFGVPVYELFIDAAGKLIASECEAHQGWHVQPHVKVTTEGSKTILLSPGKSRPLRLTARVQTGICPCGRAGCRILPAEQTPAQPVRMLAAIA